MKSQAHKVTDAVVEILNARMTTIGSAYRFSKNARGTLTYFRAYSDFGISGAAYSVARREVSDSLYFSHKLDMDAMVESAIEQWATSATVAA